MLSEDLETFLEGFVQGARCTLHIDLKKGVNGHHIWEAIFRAFGIALGRAITLDEKRKDMTAGVAGNISYEIEKM
jgi:imidazoleglycerol-phosphate dehydratase